MQEDGILNGDSVQLTRTDTNKGVFGRLMVFRCRLKATSLALRLPQTDNGRMEKLLPGVRSDRIAEPGCIGTLFETIGTAILFVSISDGQVSDRGQCIIDYGIVTNRRSHNGVSFVAECSQ